MSNTLLDPRTAHSIGYDRAAFGPRSTLTYEGVSAAQLAFDTAGQARRDFLDTLAEEAIARGEVDPRIFDL